MIFIESQAGMWELTLARKLFFMRDPNKSLSPYGRGVKTMRKT